jgi:zinc transporter ZupT
VLQAHGNKLLAMQGLMLGFVFMMVLDVSLG